MDTSIENQLSYESIIKSKDLFKKAGGTTSDDFNILDVPCHKFFKIMFYFWNDPEDSNDITETGGLLAPTWTLDLSDDLWRFNSAWGYLVNNMEYERADKLQKFVELLSNINTYSPWYFKSISGIDEALNRPQAMGDFKFDDQRKQISITCLPDAFDDRIGTLLDLYRDVVWSWQNKREIIPSNLRKFDMGIYIYESPIKGLHYNEIYDNYATFNQNNEEYQTSYKYIEFHNCEFDYNSAKSGYSNVNNQEGFSPEYTINILFDDCYETRYNELMMRTIGDMVAWDTVKVAYENGGVATLLGDSIPQDNINSKYNQSTYNILHEQELNDRLNYTQNDFYAITVDDSNNEYLIDQSRLEGYPDDIIIESNNSLYSKHFNQMDPRHLEGYPHRRETGFLHNALTQLIMPGVDFISTKLKGAFLGNLHGYSLSRFGNQMHRLMNGDILGTIEAGKNMVNKIKNTHVEKTKNIYYGEYFKNLKTPDWQIKTNKKQYKTLGNLNRGKSLANNI